MLLLRNIHWVFFLIMTLGMFATDVLACPTCKESVVETQDHLTLGYYWSILFMMAMPFTLIAGWTCMIFYLRKKLKSQMSAAPAIESVI